jgi:hypothetical protein
MNPMALRVTEMGASEGCPVTGQIEVASPGWDNITSPETELTSCWCSNSRTLEEPMHEAKQMTTGQPVGAASHTIGGFSTVARIGSKSVSSRSDLICFVSGRVLFVHGGVFGCSSRMNGKPSSPVLRGLGASNGARPLDPNRVTSELPVGHNRRHITICWLVGEVAAARRCARLPAATFHSA